MIPLIQFLVMVVDLYIWVIIGSAVLSWLIAFGVVNTSNRFVYTLGDMLHRLTDPAIRPIRQFMPD
ncbi:MAG: YggT family protein, partial [Alphaproteobacteria bacterium]